MNIFHTQTEMAPMTGNEQAMIIVEASIPGTMIYSQTEMDDYSGDEESDGYSDTEYEGRLSDFTPIRKSKGIYQQQDSDTYSEEEYEEDLNEIMYEDTGGWPVRDPDKYSKYDDSEYDEDEEYENSEYGDDDEYEEYENSEYGDDDEDQPFEQLQQRAETELDRAYSEVFFDRYNYTLYWDIDCEKGSILPILCKKCSKPTFVHFEKICKEEVTGMMCKAYLLGVYQHKGIDRKLKKIYKEISSQDQLEKSCGGNDQSKYSKGENEKCLKPEYSNTEEEEYKDDRNFSRGFLNKHG